MLSRHKGTSKDSTGCEFKYTCFSEKYMTPKGRKTDSHYIVYDGKGTGRSHVIAEADTLDALKERMGRL